ncbi:short-chain dehydrogenase/reductase SDR [Pseudanabaena sp. lw0831]|uniref:SDR family NAD(P)-dependent oxidoreductase n=1 Tax=Pseudanabaena sp. lw0831 TaxID=1357935 RepID=UPI0019167482|nr:SDR family NAD(P)-dependent oxidoreductase [Pseudanabaena sp. lw0831]GBO51677.1 short-chain dehydrogenase/reductase SDR [Pseudanabaena sp. lw0831]
MSQPICVIAGFGAGVSMGVARSFAKEGYSLALIARNLEKMEANAKELRQLGYIVHTFAADTGNKDALIQVFAEIRSQFGDPEVLIYNAAVMTMTKPSDLPTEKLISDFNVNVVGALVAAQQVIPAMKSSGKGTILFTGGGLALYPSSDLVSLAISKSGLRSLTFCLAEELKEFGIHVGTVTICGTVEVGTHFDPDAIAQSYMTLHKQPPEKFEAEIIYQ